MDTEEHGHEQRVIYNVILVTVTVLGVAYLSWARCSAPLPPSITLNSLSASYTIGTSKFYPESKKYDDTVFLVNITVKNNDRRRATVEYLDVWINSRAKTFLRSKLAQRISLDPIVLAKGETRELELEIDQDRPLKYTDWDNLIVSVFVRAIFKEEKDFLGRLKKAHKTRDCTGLSATVHDDIKTARVNNLLPMMCEAPY